MYSFPIPHTSHSTNLSKLQYTIFYCKKWLHKMVIFRFRNTPYIHINMEQNTLLHFEDTVEEDAIVREGILRNRAFSGCCNDSNRTPGWVALLSRGRINIMCRGLASSHTPDGGSADDKAFSRPWKDKEALDSSLDYLKGYAQNETRSLRGGRFEDFFFLPCDLFSGCWMISNCYSREGE